MPEPKETKVYKVLRKMDDGRLLSSYVSPTGYRGRPTWPSRDYNAKELEYKEGEVTVAPEGSDGVYCYRTFEDCFGYHSPINIADDYQDKNIGVVYEAIAYGEPKEPTFAFKSILLGKQVWPEPEPEEVWEDVTEECTVKLTPVGHGKYGYIITLSYKGDWLVEFYGDCPPRVHLTGDRGKLAFAAQDGIDGDWFSILKKVQ